MAKSVLNSPDSVWISPPASPRLRGQLRVNHARDLDLLLRDDISIRALPRARGSRAALNRPSADGRCASSRGVEATASRAPRARLLSEAQAGRNTEAARGVVGPLARHADFHLDAASRIASRACLRARDLGLLVLLVKSIPQKRRGAVFRRRRGATTRTTARGSAAAAAADGFGRAHGRFWGRRRGARRRQRAQVERPRATAARASARFGRGLGEDGVDVVAARRGRRRLRRDSLARPRPAPWPAASARRSRPRPPAGPAERPRDSSPDARPARPPPGRLGSDAAPKARARGFGERRRRLQPGRARAAGAASRGAVGRFARVAAPLPAQLPAQPQAPRPAPAAGAGSGAATALAPFDSCAGLASFIATRLRHDRFHLWGGPVAQQRRRRQGQAPPWSLPWRRAEGLQLRLVG